MAQTNRPHFTFYYCFAVIMYLQTCMVYEIFKTRALEIWVSGPSASFKSGTAIRQITYDFLEIFDAKE